MHTCLVISILWLPAQFTAQFAGIHGIAHVVTWTVVDVLVPIFTLTHQFANQLNHHLVIDVVIVSADDVSFTQFAFFQDEVNGSVVVIDVNPVADLLADAIQFWLDIAQNISDLARNELFDVPL